MWQQRQCERPCGGQRQRERHFDKACGHQNGRMHPSSWCTEVKSQTISGAGVVSPLLMRHVMFAVGIRCGGCHELL